jgi:inner membrane protein
MQSALAGARNSVTVKALFIGILILLLLIPVAMIKGVIRDRTQVSHQAEIDVQRSWGGEQRVAGPVMIVPYTRTLLNQRGESFERTYRAYVLPRILDVDATIRPDTRYRGIHEVTVYTGVIRISGVFDEPSIDDVPDAVGTIVHDDLQIALGVSDARAITKKPEIAIGDKTAGFAPNGVVRDGLPPQIVASIGNVFESGSAEFTLELHLNGTSSLRFLPLGDTTTVTMQSSWPSPSFVGSYLPESRTVSEQGFDARWQVSSLGRPLPSAWIEGAVNASLAPQSEFGVELFVPVGMYQLSDRATKYAVLFIGLTFVAYFLFEVIAGLRLHPLQYLLVGFANTLFYLLLLSLSEHLGFGAAYLVSAVASTGLIAGYSNSILGQRSRAALMTLVLALLYGFLYMTLKAETYAMLAGSTGLWLTLAIVMYLTRRVDWYRNSEDRSTAEYAEVS